MQLTKQETATVLAALRFWESTSGAPFLMGDARTTEEIAEYRRETMPMHFEDEMPLSDSEIDDLCERINFDEVPKSNENELLYCLKHLVSAALSRFPKSIKNRDRFTLELARALVGRIEYETKGIPA